nr:dihydrodipicolinate synthase family protein [Oceanicola sp. D3]
MDTTQLGQHARHLLDRGARGVTLFGTTGEGASVGLSERAAGIDALLQHGCPAEAITLGICATSIADALEQITQGTRRGVQTFLLLPPFYFKGCSDDGLFAWHAELFAQADPGARFILYHIPQVSGVGLSVDLVRRLADHAPERVQAIKDSSGDWENAKALIALGTVTVLVGDERLLHRAVALGAGGSICGMANLYPERMARIVETATEDPELSAEVSRIVAKPVIPALKAVIAARSGNAAWERMRAPFAPLSAAERAELPMQEKAEA